MFQRGVRVKEPQSVVALDGVCKSYGGFKAVDDLSFSVEKGEIFGFLGPNGAGKTTTLRMILGIFPPTSGAITVLGRKTAMQARRRIGYLPEERGLYRKMRVAQTIAYFARLKGTPAHTAKRRARELLDRFDLGEFADSKVEALSKGMAQKLQLLCAVAHDPEFLILDEPFSGLDPVNQLVFEDFVRELQAEGKTLIFSTHVMAHAERLCDRFLLIAKGKNRFLGSLKEARAQMPKRLRIQTADDVAPLTRLPEVIGIHEVETNEETGEPVYEVELKEGADPQIVLKAAFDAGVRLTRFDQSEPPLHDIFVEFVADKGAAA